VAFSGSAGLRAEPWFEGSAQTSKSSIERIHRTDLRSPILVFRRTDIEPVPGGPGPGS